MTTVERPPVRGVPALIAAVVGTVLMIVGFLGGIDAALNGNGAGNTAYMVLFLIGAVLIVAALVMTLYRMIRGGSSVLAWVTIVVGLLPMIAVVILLVAARG
jgi:uncharacterized membrane-anchored protein